MLGTIIGLGVIVAIGIFLFPTISVELAKAVNQSNVSGSADTIISIAPLFLVIGMLVVAFALLFPMLRRMGMPTSGSRSDDDEDDDDDGLEEYQEEEYSYPILPKKVPRKKLNEKEIVKSKFD